MKAFLLFTMVSCISCIIQCSAQQQIHFTHLTTEDGLSHSSVFSIAQDDIGFMFFGTEDGLNKYDGNKFTVYRNIPGDTTSLPDSGIRKIFKDRSGKLWVLTLSGKLSAFNPYKNNFKRYSFNAGKDNGSIRIISIAEDIKGNLWAASTKGELFLYNRLKNIFTHLKLTEILENQLYGKHLQCMLVDGDNTIWAGTWEGLYNFNPKTKEIKYYSNDTSVNAPGGDMIFSLAEDENGNIWIGSANGGVSVFDKSTLKFKVYKNNPSQNNSISSNRIVSILIDSRKKIWIGTFDKGLDLFDTETETFENYSYNPSVKSSFSIGAVMSIYEDRSGGVWFGTGGGGINRYDLLNQNFTHIQNIPGNASGISPNPVLAICEDNLGNLWIGSDGGGINVKEKNSSTYVNYLQSPSYGSNAITVIYEDSQGDIWIGADPGADSPSGEVFKYDKKKKSFLPFKKISIKVGGVSAIHEDKFGELWVATPVDGIHRYNPITEKETIYRSNPKDLTTPGSNSIFSICEDYQGNLWFGSISAGLNVFNRMQNSFKRYDYKLNDKSSLSSNSVLCIAEDVNKNLWIGTSGGGLNKYIREKDSFIRYTADDGLPGNIVNSILPDDEGNIWIGSTKGLTKFNPATLKFNTYNKSNGLMINDLSTGAVFKSKNGRLFFGGNSGVISFDPRNVRENTYVPKVVLTDFRVFDKPLKLKQSILYTDEINLNYDQNFFTIEFASLDYTFTGRNNFEYKLEGVDKDWIKSDGRRIANYTDISNGSYKFRVRGSNSIGKYNPKETVLQIIILPPFWKTWWFRILIFISLVIVLYLLHKFRLNKLLEIERTRNRIARDLHDEISASIAGIVYFTEALKNGNKVQETPVLKKYVGLISESASQIQESISDIIWSINPENDDWDVILPKFRRYASDLCESKCIQHSIEMPESISRKLLSMEQRHDLWLIFKEIITNAVKHSLCTDIKVKLYTDSKYLLLKIYDNGIGFDSKIQGSGNGIKNIKLRCKSLNSQAEVTTSKGRGTYWKISIPLTPDIHKRR